MVDLNAAHAMTHWPSQTHYLLSVTVQGQWRFFLLNQEVHTIGRGSDSIIRIKHPGVSRLHAILTLEGNHFKLVDGNGSQPSGNGTFVNGEAIQERWISVDDVIHLGSSAVKIQIEKVGDRRTPQLSQASLTQRLPDEASSCSDDVPTFLELMQAVDLAQSDIKKSRSTFGS